jgi:hypothetical protein
MSHIWIFYGCIALATLSVGTDRADYGYLLISFALGQILLLIYAELRDNREILHKYKELLEKIQNK